MAKDRNFPESNDLGASVIGMASPKDRIAAYVLDCTLLLPIVQLFQSPFKKWILESFLFEQGSSVGLYRLFNLLIFICLFVIYYAVMLWWKGQTIGKMFFNVKVISYHGKLTFFHSLLRSVAIFFEFLCLGIPFLAIFSHSMRRPLHDRIADTFVISLKNPVGFPSKKEKWQSRVLAAAFSVLFVISSLSYLIFEGSADSSKVSFLDSEEKCEFEVSKVEGDLSQVVELQVLKKISNQCLFEQAREKIWKDEGSSLAQFALALSLVDDKKRSDEYLASVCDLDEEHHLCDVSQWLQSDNYNSKENLGLVLEQIKDKEVEGFVVVMLASQLSSKAQYKAMLTVLDKIQRSTLLEPIVASLSFHSLLGQLKWDEAYWVHKTHNHVNDKDVLHFVEQQYGGDHLSAKQQLQLLDLFYPNLSDKNSGRAPASSSSVPEEIRVIYELIERDL